MAEILITVHEKVFCILKVFFGILLRDKFETLKMSNDLGKGPGLKFRNHNLKF